MVRGARDVASGSASTALHASLRSEERTRPCDADEDSVAIAEVLVGSGPASARSRGNEGLLGPAAGAVVGREPETLPHQFVAATPVARAARPLTAASSAENRLPTIVSATCGFAFSFSAEESTAWAGWAVVFAETRASTPLIRSSSS